MTKSGEKPRWIRVAEQFEASGQTQREFAQQQKLPLSTLQSWVYRRRRQEAGTQSPAVRLLPVELSSSLGAASSCVEVRTRSGARLSVEPGTDVEYVARLVAALERSAC